MPVTAEPTCARRDRGLGNRRVAQALGSELLDQPARRGEDAADLSDVLAEHEHARVALHFLPDRFLIASAKLISRETPGLGSAGV
jgi:hypothetical protein